MNKYALFGTYEVSTRMNVEVLAEDDNIEKIKTIRDKIHKLNELLCDECRYKPNNPEVTELLDNHLSSIDITDDMADYIHEITPIGIFELKQVNEQ